MSVKLAGNQIATATDNELYEEINKRMISKQKITDPTIFIPSQEEIIQIEEGTGDNLLSEDRANGYVDYVNYDRYSAGDQADDPIDGGMLLYKEYIRDTFSSMVEVIPDILEEAYDDRNLPYLILSGGGLF